MPNQALSNGFAVTLKHGSFESAELS